MTPSPTSVPAIRVRDAHDTPRTIHAEGEYVLYWMTANRRPAWNFSLDHAIDWARELGRPLVVLEALRIDYRWASDRLHAFVVEGLRDNRDAFGSIPGVAYYPYVELERGAGGGLLAALASRASIVVGDDYPCFFLPAQARAARRAVPCRYELIDSNGLYPLRATDKVFSRAYDFRRQLHKDLTPHLAEAPRADPLEDLDLPDAEGILDAELAKWPAVTDEQLQAPGEFVATLPIDHGVRPVAREPGGWVAARERLGRFIDHRLPRYDERNQPEAEAPSELSAHLHYGHISAHEVFDAVARREEWTPGRLAAKPTGSRSGWWGMSEVAEGFLDELITWREVGFNMASKRPDYDRYESLPDWAQATLQEHATDEREHIYTLEQFEQAQTHNELWNAAQRQLVREGRIHNYLRMLWGKKILHWSESPREALRIMIELNNKYALDGRDPNSYSGIFWVLGRYDRPWGPERPIFGKIRYMTADNTARKVSVKEYVRRYAADGERSLL